MILLVPAGVTMRGKVERLSPEELERITLELLKYDPELKHDPALHPEILHEIRRRADELFKLLSGEIAAVDEAGRAWRQVWAIAALTLIAASLLVLGTAFRGTLLLGLVTLGTLTALAQSNAIRRRSVTASRELRRALTSPLRALIRLVISDLQSDEARWSGTLRTSEAPALVELNIQDTIPSRTYERLRSFICGHESSATGLAGARGSGKTTLMRQLRLDEGLDCHVAMISTPVQYSAVEFTRLIHGELAQVGLKPGEGGLIRNRMAVPAARAVVRTLVASVAVLLMVMLWIYDKNRPSPNTFNLGWMGFATVVLGALIAGFFLSRQRDLFQRRTKLMVPPQTTRELCLQQLEFLRWSTTVERSANTAAKVGGTGFEGLSKFSRTEREVTHAESVQALRQFVDQLLALSNRPVIICVDELDKLANPAEAVDAINGLKDLFHIAKAHFVLSVSSDAMHSFAARGVPVRDVFDSAFDTVISVGPLSLGESQTLISRRARDFSRVFALFCHAWSGGHARDLIRTARSCVEQKSELQGEEEATIARLSQRVLRQDLRDVVDATIERLRSESDDLAKAMLDRVLTFQERLEDESTDLYDLVESSEFPPEAGIVTVEAQAAAALAPYARIAGLCERLFSVARQPATWRTEAMCNAIIALAEARSSLGRHPREIERKLQRAAHACAAVDSSG
ncbi:hypothetical protein [Nonomuraea sp. NPDC050540]|uniref:hypothetical protein n=1 Tax=Nonomuraea sp. NPDC050540 TaxID=3364367 RepID=UPI0037A24F73